MTRSRAFFASASLLLISFWGCSESTTTDAGPDECVSTIEVDTTRGECSETLTFVPRVDMRVAGDNRVITANNIPDHAVGLFGNMQGALNPNAIREQSSTYQVNTAPVLSGTTTQLLSANGPAYSFGVLLNGVEVDPIAAEPWPHRGFMAANVNWQWNLEASMVQIGLDCNNAHVQPNGKYHYHARPTRYLEQINPSAAEMTLVGYAADGFPIYYKYGYIVASDSTSGLKELFSSYQLKSGQRPGDGVSAPCGEYTGVYSADFEYVNGQGDLDECNGRTGVTPEFPNGTYYYLITDDFPRIPRCFKGTPSNDFRIGR